MPLLLIQIQHFFPAFFLASDGPSIVAPASTLAFLVMVMTVLMDDQVYTSTT